MAYGDSFSAVQSADLAESNARQAALRNSLAFAASGVDAATRGQEIANRQAMLREQMKRDQERYEADFYRQNERDITAQSERDRRFKMDQDYFDWQKKQAVEPKTADRRLVLGYATQEADSGAYDTPEHVIALHPELESGEAQALWERSQRARQAIEQDHHTANLVAGTINRFTSAQQTIPLLKKRIEAGHHLLSPNDPDYEDNKRLLEQEEATLAKLAPQMQRINADKNLARLVAYDPEQDMLVPTVPKPTWVRSTNVKEGEQSGGAVPAPSARPGRSTTSTGTTPPARTGAYSQNFTNRVRVLISQGLTPKDAVARALLQEGVK